MKALHQSLLIGAAFFSGSLGGASALIALQTENTESPEQRASRHAGASERRTAPTLVERIVVVKQVQEPPAAVNGSALLQDGSARPEQGSALFEQGSEEGSRSAAEVLAELEAAYLSLRADVDELQGAAEELHGAAEESVQADAIFADGFTNAEGVMMADAAAEHRAGDPAMRAEPQLTSQEINIEDNRQSQVAVFNNYVAYPVVVDSQAERSARADTRRQAGTTLGYFATPTSGGSTVAVGVNLDAGRVDVQSSTFGTPTYSQRNPTPTYSQRNPTPTRSQRSPTPTRSQQRSAHQQNPWAPVDYSQHHNPWGSNRIP